MAEKSKLDDNNPIARRDFLRGAGTAVAAGVAPAAGAQAQQPAAGPTSEPSTYLTLTETEVAFFTGAADTMIPADELTPSGTDCGIVTFIDRQLASAWGGGAKMYRNGPFRKAKPEYGYQLPLTPRQFFAAGVVATNAWTHKVYGKDFDGKAFFEALLQITMEGFFADPIYGGNRNKASWRMIGFPGLPAVYSKLIEEYRNKRYAAEPQSIADFS